MSPLGQGLSGSEQERLYRPVIFNGQIDLRDPLNQELPVLMPFLAVPLENVCPLKEVVLFSNFERPGAATVMRGSGVLWHEGTRG